MRNENMLVDIAGFSLSIPIMERKEKFQSGDITVILSLFKRPHAIEEQIKAIEWQTVKPKEIIIINNGCFSPIPEWIKEKYTIIENNVNFGVRFRFTVALNATTKYVNVIDDDTIPWSKRLENCLNESEKQRWLYGTIGCRFGTRRRWQERRSDDPVTRREHYYSYNRYWWDNNNEQTREADLIGHSRFFEREFLLKAYFAEPIPDSPYCGEDMRFSYTLQKYMWLWSYVPPHPAGDIEMRWSIKWWDLWTKNASRVEHWKWDDDIYDNFYKYIRKNGFKILLER